MNQPSVAHLADAAEHVGQLIAAVRPDQWSDPTPCSEWDVRALVTHVIDGNARFACAIRGTEPASAAGAADLPDAFARNAADLLAAFREPGALEKIVDVPFGRVPGAVALHLQLTEFLVHGWDLARATGQRANFADDLAEQGLAFTLGALSSVPPDRKPFADPQPVDGSASPLDRLAATLGRNVG